MSKSKLRDFELQLFGEADDSEYRLKRALSKSIIKQVVNKNHNNNNDNNMTETSAENQPNIEMPSLGGWWQSWTDPSVYSSTPPPPTSTSTYGTVASDTNHSGDDHERGASDPKPVEMDIEDAMERLGMGAFQMQILIAAGLCFAADAMEVLLLSFLSVILKVEWGLEAYQNNTLISVVFLGAMIGTLVLSPLGDSWGRRPVFSLTAAIIAVFGVGTAFCNTYQMLLVARFMVGFGVGGLVVPFDTLAEFLPAEFRGPNLLYIEFFWTAGTLLVPIFAWFTLGNSGDGESEEGSWRLFCILCAIPCIISTILGIFLVPESPRWLLTKRKNEEALAIMRQAATRNGLDAYAVFPLGTHLVQDEPEEHGSVCDLFSKKWFKTTVLLWVAWFGLAFLYYGAILAVSMVFTKVEEGADGEDGLYEFDYQAIFISASSEIVGLIMVLLTIDRWGRIKTQTFTYLLGGVCCLLLGYAAHYGAARPLLVFLAFCARMAMMGATCTTWVSTSEILTTDIRATGHGYANAMSRLGGFFCPYIISEKTGMNFIGLFLFSVSCISAAVVWYLPETAGKKMGESQKSASGTNLKEVHDQYNRFQS